MASSPTGRPHPLTLALDPASPHTLQRQLYVALRDAILERRLPPGARLPGSRTLAESLDISRTTVALVFEQLRAEGYLRGARRAGTFVARILPDEHLRAQPAAAAGIPGAAPSDPERATAPVADLPIAPAVPLSQRGAMLAGLSVTSSPMRALTGARPFRLGTPALDRFPLQLWGRLLARRWRRLTAPQLAYAAPYGDPALREAIAGYVRQARAVRCDPGQVIIVSGAQQAFDLCARVLLDPGDHAALEDPGYRGTRAALQAAGATLVPVPVDRDGIDVGALDALPVAPRVACTTPSHQFPLGVTLTVARRLALLDWARRRSAWIIEDDFDSEYRFHGRPLPSLQGMDHDGRVVYVGTFSKTLFPALRLGYLIAPPALVEPFARARAALDRHPSSLEQLVLADFIADGHFARHVRRMRALYAERQETLLSLLAPHADWLQPTPVDAGMHLVAWLREAGDDQRLAAHALDAGVVTSSLSALRMASPARPALLLGFAGFDREAMVRALDVLVCVARREGVAP